jgi:hypothetical protein
MLFFLRSRPEPPRPAVRVDAPAPRATASPTPIPEPTPTPVEWPELRALDELVHQAHELSLLHKHLEVRAMVPDLAKASKAVLAGTIPQLPGADSAWMQRRVASLQQNIEILDGVLNPSKNNIVGALTASAKLHDAINSLIDNVEVMMGATAARHQGILRSEHAHADHNCGP